MWSTGGLMQRWRTIDQRQVLGCTEVAAVDSIADRGMACSWRAIDYSYLHPCEIS